jgi:hypothetical protein
MFSKGHVEVRNARLRGIEMGYPVTADYDLSRNSVDNTLIIRRMDLKLNRTPISIDGKVNSASAPAAIELHVRAADGSIAEIARLCAALGIAFNANQNVSGRINVDVQAKGPATAPTLDGKISARNISIQGNNVKSPVQVDALDLAFSPEAIRSNEFVAKTGKTQVAAQVAINGYTSAVPRLQAKVNTGAAELGDLIEVTRAYGIDSEPGFEGSGAIRLSIAVEGPLREPSAWTYDGSGVVNNAELRIPSLGGKPAHVRQADLRFTSNSLMVNDLDFSIGGTSARGSLAAYNLAQPRVDFALAADKINVPEWQEMAQPQADQKSSTRESLLARVVGSGQLSAQRVSYDQLTLNNVRSTVKLDRGIITMNPITAGLYNGQEVGSIVFNVNAHPVTYAVNSKLENIDANLFLSSVSSLKDTLYGVMSASTNGRFSADGSANHIAHSLNGRISVNVANGKLANMDILHQLATIGQFVRASRAVEPFTKLIRLNGDFDITNGVARTKNLEAAIQDGSLAADGTVDLATQALNMRLTAVLSQDYSQTVGGTRIAGLMNTVLPNQRGEFVIPVLLTGTLQNPKFAPDFEMIARMKLQNLVPTLGQPNALTSAILGRVLGAAGKGEPAKPDSSQPQDLLRDIFEGVFGSRN